MSFQKIKVALKFFPPKEKLQLIKFFLRKKINKTTAFTGDPDVMDRYNKVFFLDQKGVQVSTAADGLIQLSYSINNKPFTSFIRPLTSDIDVFISVILGSEYKSVTADKRRTLQATPLIVDAGANIGFTSLFLHAYYPTSKLVCIEPDPQNLQLLKKNLEANGVENYSVLDSALWTDNSVLQLHSQFRDGDSWAKSVIPAGAPIAESYSVKGYTINQLLADYSQYQPFIFKIDIEGAETYLFKSADFVQKLRDLFPYVIIEIHDEFKIRETIYDLMQQQFDISEHDDVTLFAKKNVAEVKVPGVIID